MDANQDREFRMSPYLYPNLRDSREVIPNPDYHPPIFFIGGRFWLDATCKRPLDEADVPEYVRAAAAEVPPPPTVVKRVTITADPAAYDRRGGHMDAAQLLEGLTEVNQPARRASRLKSESRVGHPD